MPGISSGCLIPASDSSVGTKSMKLTGAATSLPAGTGARWRHFSGTCTTSATAMPFLVAIALRTRHAAAIVGIIEYDRILVQPGLLQLAQMVSDKSVHPLHQIVIAGKVPPHLGRIGKIGGQADVLWPDMPLGHAEQAGFVR